MSWRIAPIGRGDNLLYSQAGTPSLDLRFASNKSLVDAITGSNLVDFTRASSGTYVGSDGLIKTATTNEPRFDHDPTTGESLGLLVEESRTNLFLNSVWAGATTGTPGNAPTNWVTAFGANTETTLVSSVFGSADGAQAIKFSADSGERIMFAQTINVVSGTTYTLSVNVESIVGNIGKVLTVIAGTAGRTIISGDVDTTNSGKAVLVFTADSTGTVNIRVGVGTTVGVSETVEATLSRPQLEAGSFPTSYIPTSGAGVITPGYTAPAVTRAADVASISGSNFSGWYRQDEGTVFSEWDAAAFTARPVSFNDGGGNNAIGLVGTSGYIGQNIYVGNSFEGTAGVNGSYLPNTVYRQVGSYAVNNAIDSVNGALGPVDTSCSIPTVNQALIGQGRTGGSSPHSGHIHRLTYWPARLPNETLQTITQ